jgi:hypothetical protein
MKPLRVAVLLALALLAGFDGRFLPVGLGAREDATAVDWVVDDAECRCRAGNGCWHYLRSPASPPADPCWCNFCVRVSRHDGTRPMPEGWSEVCASNGKVECFLRRHAASWGAACSRCVEPRKCCNNPHPDACPACESGKAPFAKEAVDAILERATREVGTFATRDVVAILGTHFYVVTDIPSLKVKTQGGAPRVVGTHELAHIYMERCEKARREFVRLLGTEVVASAPSAVYLPRKETTAEKVQARNFGNARTNVLYGGGAAGGRLADGLCGNGFSTSLQKHGGDDDSLHQAVRHMTGHLLVSTWVNGSPNERNLPPWLFEGIAHWLGKRHPLLADEVVWCAGEGNAITGSGRDWPAEARKIAADSRLDPIEVLLSKSTVGLLTYEDHVRAWSWFDTCLREDREKFVAVLRALREAVPSRQAWTQGAACTPEQWDRRWRDRVLGRRPTMGEVPEDREKEDSPGAADRRALRSESTPEVLSARVRGLGECRDPLTAAVLVDLLARRSDRVRESVIALLSKSADPSVLAAVRDRGLAHPDHLARGFAARILGSARFAEAVPALRAATADKEWFVRAEAALALAMAPEPATATALGPLLEDGSPRVRIAALDTLASAGASGERVLSRVAANLDHGAWQVRSAAADALGGIGSMGGVEPLLNRMTAESGRIRVDCRNALQAITRNDLGLDPVYWTKWWKKERERAGGGLPSRPGEAPAPNPEDDRYAVRYRPYGIRVFDERVGYVLDASGSMHQTFVPEETSSRRLRRVYKGATKFDISKEEILQSLQGLDPRARFTVVAFADTPRFLSRSLLPADEEGRGKAETFLRNCRLPPPAPPRRGDRAPAPPMTSFYDAFLAILGLNDSGDPPSGLPETPDTMFFLTDGNPTKGEIIDADELNAWFRGHNRYARIRVHVVAFGTTGIDLPFLTRLAEGNGGRLVHILEAPPEQGSTPPPTTPK